MVRGAREISDAHRQVLFHGKSMVAEAIRAGEALRRAKEQHAHGKFTAWVENETGVPIRTAQAYMKAAKNAGACAFPPEDITLHEVLYGEKQADQRARKKAEAAATFTREDAEYALKIHALVERGATEGERVLTLLGTSQIISARAWPGRFFSAARSLPWRGSRFSWASRSALFPQRWSFL